MSDVYGPSFGGNDFPIVTAARQMVSLVPLYKAALVALRDPQASLGTQALMRSLLEAWAHLYFIMGTDELRGAPCRALQVELGWVQNAKGILLEVGPVPGGLLAEVEARIRVLVSCRRPSAVPSVVPTTTATCRRLCTSYRR